MRRRNGVLVLDVENVRGKSGFALSHVELVDVLSRWMMACQIKRGHVILVVDHGSARHAYWTASASASASATTTTTDTDTATSTAAATTTGVDKNTRKNQQDQEPCTRSMPAAAAAGLGIVFAGPDQKADDVIARDLGMISQWTQQQKWKHTQQCTASNIDVASAGVTPPPSSMAPVMVVTGDQGLIGRCRKLSLAKACLEIVPPLSLLEELERLAASSMVVVNHSSASSDQATAANEITWGTEWLLVHSRIEASRHKHVPNKRRKRMQQELEKWHTKMEQSLLGQRVYQFVQSVVLVNNNNNNNNTKPNDSDANIVVTNNNRSTQDDMALHPDIQAAVMAKWNYMQESFQYRPYKKETTEDRIVLAEAFRDVLESNFRHSTDFHCVVNDHTNSNNNTNDNTSNSNYTTQQHMTPGEMYVQDYLRRHKQATYVHHVSS